VTDPTTTPTAALVRAEALAAVFTAGCAQYPELFALEVSRHLQCDPDTLTVFAVDPATGARRHGVTPAMVGAEVRDRCDRDQDYGRFFHRPR